MHLVQSKSTVGIVPILGPPKVRDMPVGGVNVNADHSVHGSDLEKDEGRRG